MTVNNNDWNHSELPIGMHMGQERATQHNNKLANMDFMPDRVSIPPKATSINSGNPQRKKKIMRPDRGSHGDVPIQHMEEPYVNPFA